MQVHVHCTCTCSINSSCCLEHTSLLIIHHKHTIVHVYCYSSANSTIIINHHCLIYTHIWYYDPCKHIWCFDPYCNVHVSTGIHVQNHYYHNNTVHTMYDMHVYMIRLLLILMISCLIDSHTH